MNPGLEGKVALVTGAGRDIGREIALTLAGEGADQVEGRGPAEPCRSAGVVIDMPLALIWRYSGWV